MKGSPQDSEPEFPKAIAISKDGAETVVAEPPNPCLQDGESIHLDEVAKGLNIPGIETAIPVVRIVTAGSSSRVRGVSFRAIGWKD